MAALPATATRRQGQTAKGGPIPPPRPWVCNVAGGPQQYAGTNPGSTPLGLEEAHRELTISPAPFDEVAAELGRTLDFFQVPEREKEEVLAAFAAHKGEVTEGYSQ
jgi:hemoglobin